MSTVIFGFGTDWAIPEQAAKNIRALVAGGQLLPDGTDLATWRTPGVWIVPSATSARTIVGLPAARAGALIVHTADGASATIQHFIAYVSTTAMPETYTRGSLSASSTSWSPWAAASIGKGVLPGTKDAPTDIATWTNGGAWGVSALSSVIDWPAPRGGVLEVVTIPGTSVRIQRATSLPDPEGITHVWQRASGTTAGWAGIAWTKVGAAEGSAPTGDGSMTTADRVWLESAHRHQVIRNHFTSRRGGRIGTGGAGVLCIRIDHWLEDFKRDLMPSLLRYDLPASICMNSQNWGVPVTVAGAEAPGTGNNGNVTPEELQQWSLAHGFDVANHSRTHAGSNDPDGIISEIVGGQQELQLQLPRLVVDEWHMPGVASELAYDGFGNGNRIESWSDKLAGAAILHSHGHASGYMGGFWHELTGSPQIGEMPQGADNRSLADRIADVEAAARMGKGLVHLIHGNAVASGQLALADWEAFCAHIAKMRDEGRLLVLTTAGESVSDVRSDYRAEVIDGADFTDLTAWGGSLPAGWSLDTGGPVSMSATSSRATQAILLHSRHGWVQGAQVEICADVRATTDVPGSFGIELYDMSSRENFDVTRTWEIPAGGEWVTVRQNVTIPRIGDLTQLRLYVGRVGTSGAMQMRNLHMRPI